MKAMRTKEQFDTLIARAFSARRNLSFQPHKRQTQADLMDRFFAWARRQHWDPLGWMVISTRERV